MAKKIAIPLFVLVLVLMAADWRALHGQGQNFPGGSSAFPLTISGTVNSGGVPCFTSATQESSSATLTANVIPKGGGAGVCPGNSSITDNGTVVFLTAESFSVASNGQNIKSPLYATASACAGVGTTATPSVASCGSSAAGVFSCNDTTNGICQVNTTAILSANSAVIVTQDESTATGTLLGVTCNATPSVVNPSVITAKVAATSFTFKTTAATTPCFQYWIID